MAIEKIDYDVAPEDIVIEETQEQLKSTQEQIMDGLSVEQKAKATPSAIVQDRESQQQNLAVEGLSDKEKLKEIKNYFKDMNNLLSSVGDSIHSDGYKLSILEDTVDDAGYSTKATLQKDNKEVFVFELTSNVFHKEFGKNYPVNGAMKVDGQQLLYNYDNKNDRGLYDNYNVLAKAKSYKTIIEKMVSDYNAKKIGVKK